MSAAIVWLTGCLGNDGCGCRFAARLRIQLRHVAARPPDAAETAIGQRNNRGRDISRPGRRNLLLTQFRKNFPE